LCALAIGGDPRGCFNLETCATTGTALKGRVAQAVAVLLTESGLQVGMPARRPIKSRGTMSRASLRNVAALLGVALVVSLATSATLAQGDPKLGSKPAPAEGDSRKDGQRKLDEFAEAAKALGGPAAHPECVWLGRRVVGLMWRDDLDTAFRHLDLYDRFGCPAGHIQATFRCLVRQGSFDPKSTETLAGRVHTCWIDPNLEAKNASTAATPSAGAPPATPR
jgi:hypothetical protein